MKKEQREIEELKKQIEELKDKNKNMLIHFMNKTKELNEKNELLTTAFDQLSDVSNAIIVSFVKMCGVVMEKGEIIATIPAPKVEEVNDWILTTTVSDNQMQIRMVKNENKVQQSED